MIEYVEVVNDDKRLKMILTQPEESGYAIEKIDGLGPTDASINLTKISSSDVQLFNSASLGERNITMSIIPYVLSGERDIEDLRLGLYSIFPTKKDITLYFKTKNRYVYINGYVESNEPDIFSENEKVNISIICADPFFYDVETGSNTEEFAGTVKNFKFPFCNPSLTEKKIVFGLITHHADNVFNYPGEYETGFNITIHLDGDVIDPVIYDVKYEQQLKLLSSKIESICGTGLKAGDTIYICTIPSKKSIILVKNAVLYNILDSMDIRVSEWLTLKPGENTYTINASSGSYHMEVKYDYTVSYGGI